MSRRRLLRIHSLCGKDLSFAPTSALSSPCVELILPSPEPFHLHYQQYLHTVGHRNRGRDWKAVCESSFGSCQSHQRRQLFGEGIPANHHHERKLLGYTQEQLYSVVSDVAHYKEFVPWCQRSVVTQERPPDFVEAELEVGFKMFVERYSSQVYLTAPSKVLSKVSDSTLFDHLDTTWEFKRGPTPSTTWLSFDLDFAFKSPLYRHIASIFFDEVVKRMMSAFEGRCRTLYGDSSLQQRRKVAA